MNSEPENQYYPSIRQSIGLLLKMILISIPLVLPVTFLSKLLKYLELDVLRIDSIIFLFVQVALLSIVLFIGLSSFRATNQSDYRLKFKKIPVKTMVLLLAVLISGIFISEPLDSLIPIPDAIRDYILKIFQPNICFFLSVVVAAPVLEEILFRGIILEGFRRNYSPHKAIIWSAVIFGCTLGILTGGIYLLNKNFHANQPDPLQAQESTP